MSKFFLLLFIILLSTFDCVASNLYDITSVNISANSSIIYNPALVENIYGLTLFGTYFKTSDWYGQNQTYIRTRNIGCSFQEDSFIPGLFLKVLWNSFKWGYESKYGDGSKEKNLVYLHQSFNIKRISIGINEKIYSFSKYKGAVEYDNFDGMGMDMGIKYKLLNYLWCNAGINDIGWTKIESDYGDYFYINPGYIAGIEFLFDQFYFLYSFYFDSDKLHIYSNIKLYTFQFLCLNISIYTFQFFDNLIISYSTGFDIKFQFFKLKYEYIYFKFPDTGVSQIINNFSIQFNIR